MANCKVLYIGKEEAISEYLDDILRHHVWEK